MKKLLLFFLLLLIPFTVKAVTGYDNGFSWDFEDGVLTIHPNYQVLLSTNSGANFRAYANEIKKIVIDGPLDAINYQNFRDLPELEEVVLPEKMAGQIDDYAFYNCPKLKHIDIPVGLARIGKNAFGNTGITEVEVSIFTSWIEDDAFPPGTVIKRPAEYDDIIDAGTAGNINSLNAGNSSLTSNEGYAYNNTCYNKFYYLSYYQDTAYWKLYKDGTLVVWGTNLKQGYSNSRAPWGCYKKQIKRYVYNEDKTGTLTKQNQLNHDEKLENAVYAIYSTKPVEEIMSNRLKNIYGNQFADCREDCKHSSYDVEEVYLNRGVEYVGDAFSVYDSPLKDRDIYVSKYVKTIASQDFFRSYGNDVKSTTLHIEVSPEDYISHGYSYGVTGQMSQTVFGLYNFDSILDSNGQFITYPNFSSYLNSSNYRGIIVNDIDDYYVSIDDSLAPKEIEVDGKTLYLYETYRTNAEGQAKVSIAEPQVFEEYDYYIKEIQPPEGFELDPEIYKIDMSNKVLDIVVSDYRIGERVLAKEEETEIDEITQDNPLTADFIMILVTLFILSFVLIIYNYKKGRKLI